MTVFVPIDKLTRRLSVPIITFLLVCGVGAWFRPHPVPTSLPIDIILWDYSQWLSEYIVLNILVSIASIGLIGMVLAWTFKGDKANDTG